jgi:hypothetical protein
MHYTKPTILNESKATRLITSNHEKQGVLVDTAPPVGKTELPAYEADE